MVNEGDAESLSARLLAAIDKAPVASDEDQRQRLESTRNAAARLPQLLARVPWDVIPPGWLDSIQSAFDPVVATAESYVSSDAVADELPITWTEVERMWAALDLLIAASIPEESVAEDAATFRRSTGQMTRRLTDEVEAARLEAGNVREQLATIVAERDAALEQIRAQQATLDATITEQSGRLEEVIRAQQTEFSAAQDGFRSEFAAALDEHRRGLSQSLEASAEQTSNAIAGVENSAGEVLARIEEIESKSTASYNAIGTASVAGHFQQDADREQEQADRWRLAAVVALLLVAVGTILELALSGGTLAWDETRSRIPLALAIAGFAGFAASEARNHRRAARQSRGHEVKVSSIDPYLELVDDQEEAQKVKLEYARALFVETASPAGDADSPDGDGHAEPAG